MTDAGNSWVEKFSASGEYLSQFGSYGTGNGQFRNAETIAIAQNGTIWIGDTYNGRLQSSVPRENSSPWSAPTAPAKGR